MNSAKPFEIASKIWDQMEESEAVAVDPELARKYPPGTRLPDHVAQKVINVLTTISPMVHAPPANEIEALFPPGTVGPYIGEQFLDGTWATYVGENEIQRATMENTGEGKKHYREWTMCGTRGCVVLWDAGNGWYYRIGGETTLDKFATRAVPRPPKIPITQRGPEVRVREHRRQA
jgi:hypothetical protein